jgi:hypothetical protein
MRQSLEQNRAFGWVEPNTNVHCKHARSVTEPSAGSPLRALALLCCARFASAFDGYLEVGFSRRWANEQAREQNDVRLACFGEYTTPHRLHFACVRGPATKRPSSAM